MDNLLSTNSERWDEICYGAGSSKPSEMQTRLFIHCMNALGYYSTRWKKHLAPAVPRPITEDEITDENINGMPAKEDVLETINFMQFSIMKVIH